MKPLTKMYLVKLHMHAFDKGRGSTSPVFISCLNSPLELGIQAVQFWIEKYPNLINDRFTQNFILEGLKIVLNNNTFSFDDKHYLQTKGTAMGTKVAPTYATLTLGYLEFLLQTEILNLWGEDSANYISKHWKRFLDDCFIIWNEDDERLYTFYNILNKLDPNIKFTMEESTDKIPFLDVLVKKQDTKLTTDIYYKSTDTHQYLHFKSCHPNHTKRAIPYNLARRICTIVSEEDVQNNRLNELTLNLLSRSYPKQLITDAIEKAKGHCRADLLSPRQDNSKQDIIPFVHTHNPRNIAVTPLINEINQILQNDRRTKDIYKNTEFINSKRQPKNFKIILCQSAFTKERNTVKKCGKTLCGTCNHLDEGECFKFNNFSFNIKYNMSCETKNLI